MVFLNGEFIEQKDAKISTLDRGFLFGDGVYEVIPVYNNKIFALTEHLQRLDDSLTHTKIPNPYNFKEYQDIIEKLLSSSEDNNQVIYLQITRGVGEKRNHNFENLTPTIYIRVDTLIAKSKKELQTNFKAIIQEDIRWQNCHIKATSLLASVMYATLAKERQVEEVILQKNGNITEGASSNVFILTGGIVKTPALNNCILSGITRDMVLKSCEIAGIITQQENISQEELLAADEVWISSSTREIMPICQVNDTTFTTGGSIWNKVFDTFQSLKQ